MRLAILVVAVSLSLFATEKRPVYPAAGAKPVGPYSPGIQAGGTLYVSGQGARDAAGNLPARFEDQAIQCLDNVKGVVEAAGFAMSDVTYAQVYLADMANLEALAPVWRRYFPKAQPPRAVLGTANMPTGTPIEITVVAARGRDARVYVPGVTATDAEAAFTAFEQALKKAGTSPKRLAFVNAYLTANVSAAAFEAAWKKRFPAGSSPARAAVKVDALPGGANVELTGVAARDQNRPRTAGAGCTWAGSTLYCSARGGASGTVEDQVREVLTGLLGGLKQSGLSAGDVVATNVYLDDIEEFAKMNAVYAQFFAATPPTRTTVQPFPSGQPKRVEISLVAVD